MYRHTMKWRSHLFGLFPNTTSGKALWRLFIRPTFRSRPYCGQKLYSAKCSASEAVYKYSRQNHYLKNTFSNITPLWNYWIINKNVLQFYKFSVNKAKQRTYAQLHHNAQPEMALSTFKPFHLFIHSQLTLTMSLQSSLKQRQQYHRKSLYYLITNGEKEAQKPAWISQLYWLVTWQNTKFLQFQFTKIAMYTRILKLWTSWTPLKCHQGIQN